eukprot:Lithocolla_globosa_v1_NODE_3050_length_1781_cov_15.772885.p2 type:complete len:190 gc:universal NODE_3050_length_1781_cov_15.772885:640-71(-)
MTGTAPPDILSDITHTLQMRASFKTLVGDLDRVNLFLDVRHKKSMKEDFLNLKRQLACPKQARKLKNGIIYVNSRNQVNQIYDYLRADSDVLDFVEKCTATNSAELQQWIAQCLKKPTDEKTKKIVIATSVLGLGINLNNIYVFYLFLSIFDLYFLSLFSISIFYSVLFCFIFISDCSIMLDYVRLGWI